MGSPSPACSLRAVVESKAGKVRVLPVPALPRRMLVPPRRRMPALPARRTQGLCRSRARMTCAPRAIMRCSGRCPVGASVSPDPTTAAPVAATALAPSADRIRPSRASTICITERSCRSAAEGAEVSARDSLLLAARRERRVRRVAHSRARACTLLPRSQLLSFAAPLGDPHIHRIS